MSFHRREKVLRMIKWEWFDWCINYHLNRDVTNERQIWIEETRETLWHTQSELRVWRVKEPAHGPCQQIKFNTWILEEILRRMWIQEACFNRQSFVAERKLSFKRLPIFSDIWLAMMHNTVDPVAYSAVQFVSSRWFYLVNTSWVVAATWYQWHFEICWSIMDRCISAFKE